MAKDFDQFIRSDLSTKQSQIKVVTGREPSISELTENKPVMRYVPGTGLMMYVRYNNKRYHVKFSDDPKQQGKIRVEDIGRTSDIADSFIGTEIGGTGQDLSSGTGLIKVSSGTVSAATLVNADISGSAAIDAAKITAGVLPTAQHSAHVTDNLNADGLVSGRTLGDGLESVIIWSDADVAGSSAGDSAVNSTIWQETSTSAVVKITFNYVHDAENKTIKVFANALSVGGQTATVTAGLYDMSAGTLSAQASGSAKVSNTGTTASTTFTRVLCTLDVTSGFTANLLYKGQISLHTNNGSNAAKMTGAVVLAYGS